MRATLNAIFLSVLLLIGVSLAANINTCQVIDQPGIYNVVENINSTADACIVIEADNVTLDGHGHTIIRGEGGGDTPSGIKIIGDPLRRNITIKNISVKGFYRGIWVTSNYVTNPQTWDTVSKAEISSINFTNITFDNCGYGIYLDKYINHNQISITHVRNIRGQIEKNFALIYAEEGASNIHIEDVKGEYISTVIQMNKASNVSIYRLTALDSTSAISIDGGEKINIAHISTSNVSFPITLRSSKNIIIRNINLSKELKRSLGLYGVENAVISNIHLSSADDGIYVSSHSKNVEISNCTVEDVDSIGIAILIFSTNISLNNIKFIRNNKGLVIQQDVSNVNVTNIYFSNNRYTLNISMGVSNATIENAEIIHTTENAIEMNDTVNVSMKNISIREGKKGVFTIWTAFSTFENISIINCDSVGMELINSSNNSLKDIYIDGGTYGLVLTNSSNNTIINSTACDTDMMSIAFEGTSANNKGYGNTCDGFGEVKENPSFRFYTRPCGPPIRILLTIIKKEAASGNILLSANVFAESDRPKISTISVSVFQDGKEVKTKTCTGDNIHVCNYRFYAEDGSSYEIQARACLDTGRCNSTALQKVWIISHNESAVPNSNHNAQEGEQEDWISNIVSAIISIISELIQQALNQY